MEGLEKVIEALSSDATKAVVVHGNADMDALGSAYAIARCFPGCAIFAPDGLDRVSKMVAGKMETAVREGLGDGFDMTVVVDTSSPEQLNAPEGFAPDVVIDHHKPSGRWDSAKLFVCDDSRTSCCEIVKEILDTAGIGIPRDVALMLLGGMLTDSGHFQFARPEMLPAFADLMSRHGIGMDEAMDLVEAEVSISERIAMLKAVSRVKFERIGQLIVASSSAGSFEASSCRAVLDAGADIAFVGSQRGDEFRISARATQEAVRKGVHLGDIMSRVGKETTCDGGGHGGAAGISGIGDVEAMLMICMENTMDVLRAIRSREDAQRLPDLVQKD
ncbi:MAG: DHH family phosphoesterase [Thermoplasmata archaeon]|nr:DHH family phosphoesterase [Thermoplasmata archaeon]